MLAIYILRKQALYIDEQRLSSDGREKLCKEMQKTEKTTGNVYSKKSKQKYKTGDYFLPHTDNLTNRRLNLSSYLNSQPITVNDNGYCGEDRTLFGLIKSSDWQNQRISVPSIRP